VTNKKHEKLVDKIFYSLLERGYYDFVKKEFFVFDNKRRLRYSADVAGFNYNKKNGLYEVTAYEIKTGNFNNAQKKLKTQSHNWYERINSSSHESLYTNNFVVVHSRYGIYRIKPS